MDDKKAVENKPVATARPTREAMLSQGKFMTIQILARRWGVSDNTVKRLIEEGELKGIKVRGSYKILIDSAVDYETRFSF